MMPQDNAYGKWPASGEIGILEGRNRIKEVKNDLLFGEFPRDDDDALAGRPETGFFCSI